MTTLPVGIQWARLPNRLPVIGYFWRLFTSVRFALLLIAVLAVGCFLGVIFKQVPIELGTSPTDFAQWVEQEARPHYGTFTNVMFMLGLFDVFHAPWFRASLVLLTVAIIICTINRFPAIYQTTVKAKPTVPEGFMRSAKYRAAFTLTESPDALITDIKRRGYRVKPTVEGAKLHLYADKNGWAKYMTFASHLGLIMFMFGGMLTNVEGYQRFLVIPDGQSMPVYSVYHPDQMQVLNKGFTVEYFPDGRPSDYYSDLVIYKGGEQVAEGRIRVNSPMDYGGFRFHQNSFGPTVAVDVRKADTGQVLYSETLTLSQAFGATPFEVIEIPTTDISAIVALAEGNNATDIRGGTFVRGGEEAKVAVMGFSGAGMLESTGGPDFVARLGPGESQTVNGLTFTFNGLHYFSGVVARKDPGATFIWIAALLFVPAVWITFWMARRRLWLQIVGNQVRIAGMADRFVDLQKEINAIAAKFGAPPDDREAAEPQTTPALARN